MDPCGLQMEASTLYRVTKCENKRVVEFQEMTLATAESTMCPSEALGGLLKTQTFTVDGSTEKSIGLGLAVGSLLSTVCGRSQKPNNEATERCPETTRGQAEVDKSNAGASTVDRYTYRTVAQ